MKKLFLFGILLIAMLPVVMADGWIKNPANNHYYTLTDPMKWTDAEAQAVALGGHLVTLDNWEEELWIKNTFGTNEYFWIGFNDITEEGNWVWSSGEASTYTNWDAGEPNNCGGFDIYGNCMPEDAAIMNWARGEQVYGDKWNDLAANGWSRGVVEVVKTKAGVLLGNNVPGKGIANAPGLQKEPPNDNFAKGTANK